MADEAGQIIVKSFEYKEFSGILSKLLNIAPAERNNLNSAEQHIDPRRHTSSDRQATCEATLVTKNK